MSTGLLVLRVIVGVLFAAHGAQKLFGWFGGYGLNGVGQFFESLGYRPGKAFAFVAGATETGAGLLLASGFLTPLAVAGIVGVMINAIGSVKAKQGLFGGYELDVLYAVAAAAIGFIGAGVYSVDHVIGLDYTGVAWGLGALTLGAVTGLATLLSRRQSPALQSVQAEAA